ncbi:hypothetical protein ACUXMH_005355 [Ralstonia pickettii]|jgi:hypothetical protein|uniref:Uncharacterized protein n=1 Tax=Ralstonia pickettii (strain 12J) TaxID=402626 RepID=B2UF33_RALPJ
MDTPRDDDSARSLYELFEPPLRRERKLQCLTLYDPSGRMHHLYRLGLAEPSADSHLRGRSTCVTLSTSNSRLGRTKHDPR